MDGRAAIWRVSRVLYTTALSIFVITILIGIANGIDLIAFSEESDGAIDVVGDAGRQTLLTHLHAGTLGFITLSIVAGVFRMFTGGKEVDAAVGEQARRVGIAMAVAIGLYIVAFAFTQGILRPIAGTLVFVAVAWLFSWVVARMRSRSITVAQLGMFLALVSLVLGAVFGILLGIFVSEGSLPGVSDEVGSRIGESHPATMIIGYLVLGGLALIEWLISDEPRMVRSDRAGVIQVVLVFLAGIAVLVGILADNFDIAALNVPLEVIGIVIFIVRMRRELAPRRWLESLHTLYARLATIWLIGGLVALAVLIIGIVTETWLDFEDIPRGLILALDHMNFVGSIAMVTFGLIAAAIVLPGRQGWWVLTGINVGLAFFVLGLLIDVAVLKRIGTPILGVALLTGIWLYVAGLREATEMPALVD